ncbi:hypothetical protein NFI96_018835, partial [Prochilodus magdalenae]
GRYLAGASRHSKNAFGLVPEKRLSVSSRVRRFCGTGFSVFSRLCHFQRNILAHVSRPMIHPSRKLPWLDDKFQQATKKLSRKEHGVEVLRAHVEDISAEAPAGSGWIFSYLEKEPPMISSRLIQTCSHNISMRGRHLTINKDLSRTWLFFWDTEGQPFLHVVVCHNPKIKYGQGVTSCEAGAMNEPVELSLRSEATFSMMVTQNHHTFVYIYTDLDTPAGISAYTSAVKAILAHEEHMAKQYPGLPSYSGLAWPPSITPSTSYFLKTHLQGSTVGPGCHPSLQIVRYRPRRITAQNLL